MTLFIDSLERLLIEIPPDKNTATVGFVKKTINHPFHEGHKFCFQKAKETDADYTLAFLSDYYDINNWFFNTGVSEYYKTIDVDYITNWLSNIGIDYFYYLDINSWITEWMQTYDKKELIDWSETIMKKEKYITFCETMCKTWLIMLKIMNEKRYLRRKYWIFSYKDGPIRIAMYDFCLKYTSFIPVMVDPIKGIDGNSLSSTLLENKDNISINKKIIPAKVNDIEDVDSHLRKLGYDNQFKCIRVTKSKYGKNKYTWILNKIMDDTDLGVVECLKE